MRNTNISITDIAREAGVSATTVSRVLNDKSGDIRISQKTRDLVLEVADRLNYRRNPFASALRSNRTGIIGAINRSVSGTYMSRLAHHVQLVAQTCDVELFIGAPRDSNEAIRGQLTMLQSQLFDGVLFLGDLSSYQMFTNGDFDKPHVHILPGNEEIFPFITADEATGVKLALDYLIALGHTRIACLGSPKWPWDGRRVKFYQVYMQQSNLRVYQYIADLDNTPYPAHNLFETDIRHIVMKHVDRLMQLSTRPTAIFCTNDGVGADTIKALHRLGYSVPEDVSVVGYGNHHDSIITYPELTTVGLPNPKMAEAALALLLKIIDEPENIALREERQLLLPELIIRESVSAL